MSWLHRVVLGGLLLTAYLFAWTPVRTTAVTEVAEPVLSAVAESGDMVTARPKTKTIRVDGASQSGFTVRAPAGIKFLLPGLFLILIAPARPRIWAFFAGHLGLGGLILGLAAAATVQVPGGFLLARFIQSYGVDAYSLAVPVLLFATRYSRTS